MKSFQKYQYLLFLILVFRTTAKLFASECLVDSIAPDSAAVFQGSSKQISVYKTALRLYQNFISSQYYSGCVFENSCSHFAIEAFDHKNPLLSTLFAADRIQRCHAMASLYYNNKYAYDEKVSDPIERYCFGIRPHSYTDQYQISTFLQDNTNTPFADYLISTCDYARALAEYKKCQPSAYSSLLKYKIGICYKMDLKLDLADSCFSDLLSSSSELGERALAILQLGHIYYLNNDFTHSQEILDKVPGAANPRILHEKSILQTLNRLHTKEWTNASTFLAENRPNFLSPLTYNYLRSLCERGQRIENKNTAIAASLSAILPGSGRIYCGRTMDGLSSFFLVGFSSLFTYRSFRNHGLTPLTGLLGLTSLVLYSGNVYGSYLGAKYFCQIEEEKLLNELQISIHLRLLR